MHFNRAQFAAKTEVRLLFVVILILTFLLSSCVDDIDLGGLNNIFTTQYKWSIPARTFIHKTPSFRMDSILYDSISIYKVYSSIRFDSTVSLTGIVLNYWETGKEFEGREVKQVVVDTLDFSSRSAYFYKVRITNLKPKSEYQICGWATYLLGIDTTIMQAPCKYFLTE